MKKTFLYGPYNIKIEESPEPKILEDEDAIIKIVATCICGSDLWAYRGIDPISEPIPMGHEYVGIVLEVGKGVKKIKPGQFVVGSFFASDNTCEICRAGYHSGCIRRVFMGDIGMQAEYARVPLADGTLVPTPDIPPDHLIPSLLTASDVLGTAWFAAIAADVRPGKWVAVVGDDAVGLLAVLSAKIMGAERIILMGSRNPKRQELAREFGATDIIQERGDEAVEVVKEITHGLGVHSAIEAVGTQTALMMALKVTRPGGHIGVVGVLHDVKIPGDEFFFSLVHMHGGPAPVRRFLPDLIELIWDRKIEPGKVFDVVLPLDKVAEGYKAMHERKSIKVLLKP
jgi:threonine dehydrogenase-like Zn-dependent dehydrogenase